MVFESCDGDPRVTDVLTSPELTLQSDEELTFAMIYPPAGNDRSLALYQTSSVGHPSLMLGFYSPPTYPSSYANMSTSNGTNSSSLYMYRDAAHTVCLPAGNYQLVFIAVDVNNVSPSQVALTEVSLTGTSCMYDPPSGKHRSMSLKLSVKKTAMSLLGYLCDYRDGRRFESVRYVLQQFLLVTLS